MKKSEIDIEAALTKLDDRDYVLTENAGWFELKGFAIRIYATDDGVVVDIFDDAELNTEPFINPIASAYAYSHELSSFEEK